MVLLIPRRGASPLTRLYVIATTVSPRAPPDTLYAATSTAPSPTAWSSSSALPNPTTSDCSAPAAAPPSSVLSAKTLASLSMFASLLTNNNDPFNSHFPQFPASNLYVNQVLLEIHIGCKI